MVFFIYKCYYVLFLFYSNYNREVPWVSAMFVLTATLVCLFIPLIDLFGILDTINSNIETGNPLVRRGKIFLSLVIPLCLLGWFIIHHIIFNLAKASKRDGLSERYAFTPTKRDKVICWVACSLSLSLIAIYGTVKHF